MEGQPTPQWIYQFFPVRPEMVTNPDLWTEDDIRLANDHFAYLQRATEAVTVILAGRAQDGLGPAIVIIEAPTEAAARHFMQNDPFVSGGFARATLHPFRVALARKP